MVKHFVGLSGFKIAFLDKQGKFKPARTVSWMKGAPWYFLLVALLGTMYIITGKNDDILFSILALLVVAIIAFFGFYYPMKHPLTMEEANDIEKENYKEELK